MVELFFYQSGREKPCDRENFLAGQEKKSASGKITVREIELCLCCFACACRIFYERVRDRT